MAISKHNDVIEFAGDYILRSIVLHNHEGEGVDVERRGINIMDLVVELNIYESIYRTSVLGSMVVIDTQNIIGNLPIQGTERVSFKLSTPGTSGSSSIDCSVRSGHPMHIYALTDRKQLNQSTVSYTLHFASREFLRNIRTKVSKAYSGRMDTAVRSIFQDAEYLDSKKTLYFQQTRNQDKIVIPNLPPFTAIQMLCDRALADNSKSAGYHFYETTKGFHFRSWESLCVDENNISRTVKQRFRYVPKHLQAIDNKYYKNSANPPDVEDISDKIKNDYACVEKYRFINSSHDVATNQALGTYAHRVITHNIYDKSYRHDDYNYHIDFDNLKHTDNMIDNNYAVVATPVDYDNKSVSDYPESRVSIQPTTRFTHGEDTGNFGIDVAQDGVVEGERIGQRNQIISGTRLELRVKGQSFLSAGDIIEFELPNLDANNPRVKDDPHFAGRYVITQLRHRVIDLEYIQIIECVKDGVYKPYHTQNITNYTQIADSPRNREQSQDIKDLQDY